MLQEVIFQPFTQLSTTDPRSEGSGMAGHSPFHLRQRGQINLESSPEQGAVSPAACPSSTHGTCHENSRH